MPFRDIVTAAKQTPIKRAPQPKMDETIVEQAEQISSPDAKENTITPQKRDISYADSEIKGFVPKAKTFASRANSDPRHGSIVRGIAEESGRSQAGGAVSWQECRYRKENMGKDYCTEFHCFCYKDKCKVARK